MPWNHNARVWGDDPAAQAGDAQLLTDLRGRLIWLQVVPDEAEPPVAPVATPDWIPVFREAGLDLTRFQPTQPTRNPPVASDVRAAWTGTATDAGGYQIRVEAAAYRGKTVYFEQVSARGSLLGSCACAGINAVSHQVRHDDVSREERDVARRDADNRCRARVAQLAERSWRPPRRHAPGHGGLLSPFHHLAPRRPSCSCAASRVGVVDHRVGEGAPRWRGKLGHVSRRGTVRASAARTVSRRLEPAAPAWQTAESARRP